ncbi:hypothetical protein [Nocardia amikacinitolerans]|uniref:hypothetical protein n=2 Tax=Nocardia amikacinitolerans TaxID=756689 RepID=UPI0020A51D6F|nr:hypothetical protein [Nocardia amikacinitolerans]
MRRVVPCPNSPALVRDSSNNNQIQHRWDLVIMAEDKLIDSRKNLRFAVEFADFFPDGLYQMGPVSPDLVYTGDPNRPGPQKRDELTGALVWKITVSDPAVRRARRASYEVLLLSETEPVPTTAEIGPNLRPIELVGVTVQPRIAGQGEFKYQDYMVRATGYATPPGGGNRSASGLGAGKTPA